MKVAYVTHKSNLTGANRSLLDLLDALDRSIVDPLVVVCRFGPLLKELKMRQIPYRFAFIPPTLNSDLKSLNCLKKLLNTSCMNRIGVFTCKRVFNKWQPDVIHNNTLLCSVGMEAAKRMGIPYVCHCREFLWEDHHRVWLKPERMIDLIRNASAVIAISESVAQKYMNYSPNAIYVISDGINVDHYLLPSRKILSSDEAHLLLVGRIIKGKGQLEAVKAFEIAQKNTDRKLFLHIVGNADDNNYLEEIKKYLKDAKIDNVRVSPFSKDLRALRSSCDIGLTTSSFEALGRVTIENMLSSLLVIGSDTAGTKEIISDGFTGLLYRFPDPEALANKILWAIDHPERANEIAEQGRKYAIETYENKQYAKHITSIYQTIKK